MEALRKDKIWHQLRKLEAYLLEEKAFRQAEVQQQIIFFRTAGAPVPLDLQREFSKIQAGRIVLKDLSLRARYRNCTSSHRERISHPSIRTFRHRTFR